MAVKKSLKRSVESLKASVSGKNQYLDRLIHNGQDRVLAKAALSGAWNLIYAVYHLVLAVRFQSYWFLTMGLYYLTVCGMRASALHLNGVKKKPESEIKALKRNGILMFALAVIFSGVVCLTIAERQNTVRSTIVAISMATYTFYCVTVAIIRLIQLKKVKTFQLILLRNLSVAYASGSLFGLERMMLGTFGSAESPFTVVIEAASGGGFFFLIVLLGINLRLLAARKKKSGSEMEKGALNSKN